MSERKWKNEKLSQEKNVVIINSGLSLRKKQNDGKEEEKLEKTSYCTRKWWNIMLEYYAFCDGKLCFLWYKMMEYYAFCNTKWWNIMLEYNAFCDTCLSVSVTELLAFISQKDLKSPTASASWNLLLAVTNSWSVCKYSGNWNGDWHVR